jgi:aminopeptidase N
VLAVDAYNPSVAARLVEPLGQWRRFRDDLAQQMRAELERVAAHPGLSKNVYELASRALVD